MLDIDYLKYLLMYIRHRKWNEFLAFFQREEDKQYPKALLDELRLIDPAFEKDLRYELKNYLEELRHGNRRRTPDGKIFINTKEANNYSNYNLKNDKFRRHLSSIFEDDFVVEINSVVAAYRFILKIYESTYNYPEREKGREIIEKIVYQLSDNVLRDA